MTATTDRSEYNLGGTGFNTGGGLELIPSKIYNGLEEGAVMVIAGSVQDPEHLVELLEILDLQEAAQRVSSKRNSR